MDESTGIIKEQLKKIPKILRGYISDGIWSDSISKIAKQFNISEDKGTDLENEVLFVLICLEPPKDFVENIKREVGLDENIARKVADTVNGSIFSKVMTDIKGYWENLPKEEAPASVSQNQNPQIKTYDSFEQAILRQAQAMKPAFTSPKPSGEGGLGSNEAKPASTLQTISQNVQRSSDTKPPFIPPKPSNEAAPQVPPKHYAAGSDPYREPIE